MSIAQPKAQPKAIYLKDYKPFPFKVHNLYLNFDIHDGYTVVTSRALYERTNNSTSDIFLHGEDLELLELKIDGELFSDYTVDKSGISFNIPDRDQFELEIKTKIYPEKNTRLEGLYSSSGTYCTQCEAEGFRRITYFPDRPDVMVKYTVRIESDKKYPVLLSNGNKIEEGVSQGNRHFTTWQDPYPKPCYLFALVAGDLVHIHDTYTTKSGGNVELYIYVRNGDESQCSHAMGSLKRSMKWDEDTYGLEYDLDIYNIVAVSDFNMGAMENKSLNIFNTALVLAAQETATDQDFCRVESVIAHEYFHNWSGNRVTCRDWFQLSLKEGLTVFRDQEFSADMHSAVVQRIDDVTHLRKFQFSEDASPLSHPIRPDNYIEINNFYTMTVYEKGAEVVRMLRTILGADNYRKATDLYFSRHDGQAVTCDDFVRAMEDASGINLSQFKLWYSQSGTPEITFLGEYDKENESYKITLKQSHKNPDNKPMTIPFSIGLLNDNGDDLIETQTLMLEKLEQDFVIENIKMPPIPSLLRGFSAPVKLTSNLTDSDLAFLMAHDSDGFNRYECGQIYALQVINDLLNDSNTDTSYFVASYGKMLDGAQDKALQARLITLPSIDYIGQSQDEIDPSAIYDARKLLLNNILGRNEGKIQDIYDDNRTSNEFSITSEAMGRRALQNTALSLLSYGAQDEIAPRAFAQYDGANNMSDMVAALNVLADINDDKTDQAFTDFYARFKGYPLVIDKWFSIQAAANKSNIVDNLNALKQHDDFNIKNPNRVRSLYFAFAFGNPVAFHAKDGSGYEFLRDGVIELNSINPQIAARLLTSMREWRRYTPDRQAMMKEALEEILEIKDIAPDIFEIASKSLHI